MKNAVILFLLVGLCSLQAELSKKQKRILLPHLYKINEAFPVLKISLAEAQKNYEQALQEYNLLQSQIKGNVSMIEKGVLQGKISYYEYRIDQYNEEIRETEITLYTYLGILDAFDMQDRDEELRAQAQKFLPRLKNQRKIFAKKKRKALQREEKAQFHLSQIPLEEKKVEKKLEQVKKQLAPLEYKKTWTNLQERVELNSQIAYHNSWLVKLQGEKLFQEKNIQDAKDEQKALKIQITELDVAIENLE